LITFLTPRPAARKPQQTPASQQSRISALQFGPDQCRNGQKIDYYQIRNSDLLISLDATAGNTSMIAVRVEKMVIGHGNSLPSVRLSLAGLPET
jgi:hypothetical protein